jgi:DNA-binding response OmpR family regulator
VKILLLTDSRTEVLPALDLLPHVVQVAPRADPTSAAGGPPADVVLVDACRQLSDARTTCRLLQATGLSAPLVAVVQEAGLVAVSADWCVDDFLLASAGPAEVAARLRLAVDRRGVESAARDGLIRAGDLTVDPHTYTAKLRGAALALTYKEFELLKYLAQHPGRVFSRDQLLREVWGYDYFGGTRTVDVHVRRLRAKLGPLRETMIGTVRQVGYKFVVPATDLFRGPDGADHGPEPVNGRTPASTADLSS